MTAANAASGSLASAAEAVRGRLGVRPFGVTPTVTGSVAAHARMEVGDRVVLGRGVAADVAQAVDVATVECAERWAQFHTVSAGVVRGTFTELAPAAVCPWDFGLHTEAQYVRCHGSVARFDPGQPRSWVRARSLPDGEERLVPLELVHPGAGPEQPLAEETSSGTAACTEAGGAVVAAAREVVERDAALLWWHRRPSTPVVRSGFGSAAAALSRLRAAGVVPLVCRIDRDVAVPTYLVWGLRGRSVAAGMATRPCADRALAAAVDELAADLTDPVGAEAVHLPAALVRTSADHRALYDRGPLHDALRAAFDESLRPELAEPPEHGWDALDALVAAGFSALVCDLTTTELRDCGVEVARVLVPGLVPYGVGRNGLRLGCTRLTGPDSPGRFVTRLPHPFR